jgi:hypothetical protein
MLSAAVASCSATPRASGVYTHDTRVLVRLDYDYDADGAIDVRTYMRNGRPVRLEGDTDGDGRVDRWEYYGPTGELLRIGASSASDGREDTWIRTVGGERHVDVSIERDGVIDRREVYRDGVLLRAESDTNHDGLPDRWEEFASGRLARLLVDDQKRFGRPTRRMVYGAGGKLRIEDLTPAENHGSR